LPSVDLSSLCPFLPRFHTLSSLGCLRTISSVYPVFVHAALNNFVAPYVLALPSELASLSLSYTTPPAFKFACKNSQSARNAPFCPPLYWLNKNTKYPALPPFPFLS
jgi:hypothetical protein